MTGTDLSVDDELPARLRARLDDTRYTVLENPVGWQCRRCGGRLTLADDLSEPKAFVGRTVDNLIDAAASHDERDHPNATAVGQVPWSGVRGVGVDGHLVSLELICVAQLGGH